MKIFCKLIMLMVCFAPLVANSQTVITTPKVDEFNKKVTYSTNLWVRYGQDELRNTISSYMMQIDDGIIGVSISYSSDLGCLSQNRSKLLVKLSNDTIIEFVQITSTNCSNSPTAMFWPFTANELEKLGVEELTVLARERYQLLSEYDWVMMRLHGSRYYTDIKPVKTRSIEQPEAFFRLHLHSINNSRL